MQIEQKQNRIYKPQSNTTLSAEETNQVTTELENVIIAGNLTPSAGTLTQVRDAIQNVVDTAANNLQSQIDAITSASDVFDVVGTYAELQAYDKSSVPINDIIKVLQDSTHNNAATYYRLEEESGGTTDWVYVGQEGPYYTKSETDLTFATKSELPGIATTSQVGLVKPDGQTVTVQADGTLNVSSNVAASLPLFTSIWADHILNNASYLRADTFSWQSGAVYLSAYNHLVADISGITAETETISGTTITFYRATDGHKIVLADQETNVSTIYTATGVAWYYILDTDNTRFKLPRSKWNFVGLRDNVGNYVAESLPNITGELDNVFMTAGAYKTGCLSKTVNAPSTNSGVNAGSETRYGNIVIDASDSSPAYRNSSPVQQRATQAYLYFYVGNTVQDQTTIDVGQITEALNDKADLDLSNVNNTGKSTAASWSMPSSTSDSLTLGASGSSYQMPADGYLCIGKEATAGGQYIYMGGSCAVQVWSAGAGYIQTFTPVRKGQTIYVNYTAAGTLAHFKFVYAVGAAI